MRHGIMGYGAFRLRYGVAALAMFAPLAAAGAASAAVSTTPGPVTYTNLANATSQRDFYHAFTLKYQLEQAAPTVLNASNQAVALTQNCHDCGALAIAFQVVFVSEQNLTKINAYNNANATSFNCVRCLNMAAAYQIIVASDVQTQLTEQQELGLAQVQTTLQGLQRDASDLNPTVVENIAGGLANQALSIVDNPSYGQGTPGGGPLARTSAFSPAINGSARAAALTEDTQPIADLYVDVKVSS
jgi:hypothetical protein